jgi:transcriptional regulator with XRE-family HTH domain
MKKPTKADFVRRTDALMKQHGLTQKPFAKKLGVSNAALWGYRSGRMPVSERVAAKLAELEVDVVIGDSLTERMKPVKAKAGTPLPFVNNKGEVLHLDGNLTMADLIKMGITTLGIAPKDTPLADGWFRDASMPTIRLPGQ